MLNREDVSNDEVFHTTTTIGIWFTSNRLQIQIINQQNSITTVYPPTAATTLVPPSSSSASATSISAITASANHQYENDLSVEVRRLQMKSLHDDQLAISSVDDRQPPITNTIRYCSIITLNLR